MGESDEKNPFSRNSPEIKPLRELVEQQTHKTLILWTLDCAPRFVELFEKYYPTDPRPRECLELGRLWSRGEVKMPEAKKAILAAHHAATAAEENPTAQAAARAVGHAVATVHVETHALGLVFYGLTALIYEEQPTDQAEFVETELANFYQKLLYLQDNDLAKTSQPWASFLVKDLLPNKEASLHQKENEKEFL